MKKWLAKVFCPSAASLAGYAAAGIAKSVNGSPEDVKAKIATIAAQAAAATELANRLAKMAEDGTIDQVETKTLQGMMTPWFDTALGYAFTW